MRPETAVYRSIKNRLMKYMIKLVRIENSAGIAIPDVYFYTPESEGWIEFKYIKQMPARASTTIKIPFRPGQQAWLLDRYNSNPSTLGFLLLAIGNKVFLFKNNAIKEEYTKDELYSMSTVAKYLSDQSATLVLYQALLGITYDA